MKIFESAITNIVLYTNRYAIKYITEFVILVTELNYIYWKIMKMKIRGRQNNSTALFYGLTGQRFNHRLHGLFF